MKTYLTFVGNGSGLGPLSFGALLPFLNPGRRSDQNTSEKRQRKWVVGGVGDVPGEQRPAGLGAHR